MATIRAARVAVAVAVPVAVALPAPVPAAAEGGVMAPCNKSNMCSRRDSVTAVSVISIRGAMTNDTLLSAKSTWILFVSALGICTSMRTPKGWMMYKMSSERDSVSSSSSRTCDLPSCSAACICVCNRVLICWKDGCRATLMLVTWVLIKVQWGPALLSRSIALPRPPPSPPSPLPWLWLLPISVLPSPVGMRPRAEMCPKSIFRQPRSRLLSSGTNKTGAGNSMASDKESEKEYIA